MKKFLLGASIVAASALNATQAVEITMNGGAVTQYVFRGVPQSDGKAAAQGGIDLEQSGFYLGTWISQVDTSGSIGGATPATGIEYDLYGGYGTDIGYGNTVTVGDTELFDYSFALIRSDKNLSFKTDNNGNPEQDTFFYAGVTKSFDIFSN